MYIKQIISVHPRSSCTIFCAKCGTALLKIRPFEGFAPQLYPENPKMRYSSTQAPASPSAQASALASRISLLPGFRGFSLRHSTYGSLRRCTEPAIARKGRGTGEERRNGGPEKNGELEEKRRNRRRTEKNGETAGKRRKNGKPVEERKTGGKTENRRRTEKRRNRRRNGGKGGGKGGGKRGETEEKRRNRRRTEKNGETENRRRTGGETEGKGGKGGNGGEGRKLSTGGDVRIALNFSDF